MRYLLPFTVEDIAQRAVTLRPEEQRFVRHELKGSISSMRSYLQVLEGPLSRGQRRFLDYADQALKNATAGVDALLDGTHTDVPSRAEELYAELSCLHKHFPLAARINDRGPLLDEDRKTLQLIDSIAVTLFHSYEVQFRNGELFDLGADVHRFWREYSYTRPEIAMPFPVIPPCKTKQDYFANAVLPLIKNVLCHAYPPGCKADDKRFWVRGKRDAGWLSVSVRDHGVGIHPDVASYIFEEGASSQGEGHGIGLYSVRRFMREHGGSLACVWHKVGAEFTLQMGE